MPLPELGGDGVLELPHRRRAFEPFDDPAVGADEERPRLRLELPLAHPLVEALRGVVVLVDLDVDETDVAAVEPARDLLDDVDSGAARAARAELGRREDDGEGDA